MQGGGVKWDQGELSPPSPLTLTTDFLEEVIARPASLLDPPV